MSALSGWEVVGEGPRDPLGIGELPAIFVSIGPESAESFRLRFCATCQRHALPEARRSACVEVRCGLCDSAAFDDERAWVARTMAEMWPPATIDDRAFARFEDHLARWGATTPAFVRDSEGLLRLGQRTATLRAAIHAAMVEVATIIAGDTIRIHADTKRTLHQLGQLVKRRKTQRKRWNAAQLRQEVARGSVRGIAAARNVDRATVRYALARLKEGTEDAEG